MEPHGNWSWNRTTQLATLLASSRCLLPYKSPSHWDLSRGDAKAYQKFIPEIPEINCMSNNGSWNNNQINILYIWYDETDSDLPCLSVVNEDSGWADQATEKLAAVSTTWHWQKSLHSKQKGAKLLFSTYVSINQSTNHYIYISVSCLKTDTHMYT